jgi:hypothetical protein
MHFERMNVIGLSESSGLFAVRVPDYVIVRDGVFSRLHVRSLAV